MCSVLGGAGEPRESVLLLCLSQGLRLRDECTKHISTYTREHDASSTRSPQPVASTFQSLEKQESPDFPKGRTPSHLLHGGDYQYLVYLFSLLNLFLFCTCVFFACIYICTTCMQGLQRPEDIIGSPGTDCYQQLFMGPGNQTQVLLITEPSPAPSSVYTHSACL